MASARLTALRLVGFKSFAERTLVEFGPGISAVVGPNGSGKSNLADALRWTLGEQGRQLRTRRSEDVIFAGSSSRRAIGMADVTLVVDNSDRLLPVDYAEIEIGRRLYRSGESEYLLNRQRIRLRDLVELLDAGNLADNAFLFIGQGMVDQALALRPEERRPLFEEAAGVRRHERRRRQAEQELLEAESNLDRLRDVLGELRPQARRLAAQAEQLQARRTAGVELAEGLLAAARTRWFASAQAATHQQRDLEGARAAADAALEALKSAEADAATMSVAITRRADEERTQRSALDARRAEQTELRVTVARVDSDLGGLARDAERLAGERAAAETRLADAARVLAEPGVDAGASVDDELALVERRLEELDSAAQPGAGAGDLRSLAAELEQGERRQAAAVRALATATERMAELEKRLAKAVSERDAAASAAGSGEQELRDLEGAVYASRHAVEQAAAARSAAHDRLAETEADIASARARLAALDAAIAGADDGLARAARARGATLLGEGLDVDKRFVTAVSAALGAAAAAYLVTEDSVPALAGRRGMVALSGIRGRTGSTSGAAAAIEAAQAAGGGRLVDALRRDPQAEVTRLLERVLWTPDIAAALSLRRLLPAGWRAVTLSGEVVSDDGLVALAAGGALLEQRAERTSIQALLAELEQRAAGERSGHEQAREAARQAAESAQGATATYESSRGEQRQHEEQERVAARRAEQLLRETNWERTQVARLAEEANSLDALVARLRDDVDALTAAGKPERAAADPGADLATRRATLRQRRDDLRRVRDERVARAGAAEEARRRAEIGRSLDEARLAQLETDAAGVALRIDALTTQRSDLGVRLHGLDEAVAGAAATLDALLQAGSDERARLAAAERAATDARERLRVSEATSRDAELHALEARLQLEQTREQLLVELATIGADGQRTLRQAAGLGSEEPEAPSGEPQEASAAETMEELLDRVVELWRASAAGLPPDATPPSQGRLAGLRRRFNELGAGNPYAVEEYQELRQRLESLEAQRADMESAIASTRELIASLSALINDQFRTTFAALEDAFERRFHELFGGGDAQLSLTAPDDLSVTGVEIHARPPGKKRQPLSMLSGGERALTAVSLLLAMLEVRPVPFCVLDEVDAALDEANIDRFSKALRGLAEQTQFIVITHNRGTIESADALYGVTLGDDAVSRVVSLRLPDRPVDDANGATGVQTSEDLAEVAPG